MRDTKNNFLLLPSLYLICSRISLAISGVLFWCLAARIYSIEDIGLGAALISVSSLIIFISSLGIAPTFVRFLPQKENKGKLLGTFFGLSLFLLVVLCVIFLMNSSFFLPKVDFLKTSFYPFVFFVFVLSMQIFHTLDSVYTAFNVTWLVLFKNVIQNFLKIGLLLSLFSLGSFGIFSSNCSAAIVAILISVIYFIKKHPSINFKLGIDISVLKKLLPFSLTNFLNSASLYLPGMVFPIIIISAFSQREAGLFYIPWMIFLTYCSFITSVNNIFLMKASYGENIKKLLKKTIAFSFALGLVGFLIFTIWGNKILLIFKEDFSQNSLMTLKLLFYSIFFFIINQIYITILNINEKILKLGIITSLIIISIIIFTIILLPTMKTEGMALAWLVANLIGSIYVFVDFLITGRKMLK